MSAESLSVGAPYGACAITYRLSHMLFGRGASAGPESMLHIESQDSTVRRVAGNGACQMACRASCCVNVNLNLRYGGDQQCSRTTPRNLRSHRANSGGGRAFESFTTWNAWQHPCYRWPVMTKNALLVVGMALGAIVGLLASLGDSSGLKIVMMAIGGTAGAAIGGALSRIGKRAALRRDSVPETDFPSHDRMRTFWRDKGEIYPMPGHPDPEGARREAP